MTWTTLPTWVAGQVLSSPQLNTYLINNIIELEQMWNAYNQFNTVSLNNEDQDYEVCRFTPETAGDYFIAFTVMVEGNNDDDVFRATIIDDDNNELTSATTVAGFNGVGSLMVTATTSYDVGEDLIDVIGLVANLSTLNSDATGFMFMLRTD